MIFIVGGFCGLFSQTHRHWRAGSLHRHLPGSPRAPAVGRELRHAAGGGPRVAAGGGHAGPGPGGRPGARTADLRAVRGGHLVPESPGGGDHPAGVLVLPAQAHPAGVRPDEDGGDPARARARVVTKMKDRGLSPAMIAGNKVILSGIFTTALNDQITFLHPCKGVKTPTVPVKPYTIITPEQFSAVYEALPDPTWRRLVETDIERGLRWGELTELRVRDIEFRSRMLTVSRSVVQVSPKFHRTGGRCLLKDYPRDRE